MIVLEKQVGVLSNLIREQDVLVLHENSLDSIIELGVAHTRAVEPREEVSDETQEQWNILKHKLG